MTSNRCLVLMLVLWTATVNVGVSAQDGTAQDGTPVAEPTLDDLAWMAGCWAEDDDQRSIEECWIEPRGELMLGLHRDVTPRGTFFEFLRIEIEDERIVFLASPRGAPATPFVLVGVSVGPTGGLARFENPEHDWPQRLVYRRDGEQIELVAEGLEKSARRAEWRLSRISWP